MFTYEHLFGSKPKHYVSPLEKGDHPELDTSEILDFDGVQKYQSLIGALQWVIQIGRFDVGTAVMTLSGFRAEPRKGHLERVKRIYGYLSKMRHSTIRIRTQEPDLSSIPEDSYEWERTVYAGAEEQLPTDAPSPKGQPVIMTTYADANLYHDLITGKSVTGTLNFFNKTPVDWYCKKQSTVENATYSSEFNAARTAVERCLGNRLTLRYLGVPIKGASFLFGDNRSVVDSATIPHSKLKKRHVALAYHKVREAIAAKVIRFHHIETAENPADILSKHWGYQQVWPLMQPILFWQGNTADIPISGSSREMKGE